MNRVKESASNYHEALTIQHDRLQISDWLVSQHSEQEPCPICGNSMEEDSQILRSLQSSLKDLESAAGGSVDIPAAFDREFQRVQLDVGVNTEKLKAVQLRQKALSSRSAEAREHQFQAQRAERFVGNLENALQLYRRLGEDAELRTDVEKLRQREENLSIELREQDIENRKRRALQIVNSNAGRLIPLLDAERPNDPISLEINDLTIKVIGVNRDDYLSEVGSGSNWLSYHIAVIIGLQQHFLALEHSAVPSFVVIDQPSQVYFPKRVASNSNESDDPKLRDEDVEAVKKAFQVLSNAVTAARGQLQIIVLDHAPREVWGDIPNIVEFEEWRDGIKLVPEDWLNNNRERLEAVLDDRLIEIENDDIVSGQIAMTNATGFLVDEYEITSDVVEEDGVISASIEFRLSGDQDQDKPWSGTVITGSAKVSFDGRNLRFSDTAAERDLE